MMPNAVPIGIRHGQAGAKISLNPKADYMLTGVDEVVVIAEDNDTYDVEDKHGCKVGESGGSASEACLP